SHFVYNRVYFYIIFFFFFFFFQAEDGIRDYKVTGVQTCALRCALGVRGVRQQVHVQIAVAVIVEEQGLGGESGEVETVLLGSIGEGAVAVVDVEHVVPVQRRKVDGGDVDINVTVAVDVGHRDAGLPGPRVGDTGPLGDVHEPVVALVQVEPVGAEVRSEVEVGQAVVVDVADGHAAAVVVVHVVENAERGVVGQPIDERDTAALGSQPLEQLRRANATAGGDRQRRDQQHGNRLRRPAA